MVLRPGSAGEKGGAGITPALARWVWRTVPLERGDRKLNVRDCTQKMAPDQPAQGQGREVPEAKAKAPGHSLSAVDVGILNITSFKTPPDPHGFSFGKLAATGTTPVMTCSGQRH